MSPWVKQIALDQKLYNFLPLGKVTQLPMGYELRLLIVNHRSARLGEDRMKP